MLKQFHECYLICPIHYYNLYYLSSIFFYYKYKGTIKKGWYKTDGSGFRRSDEVGSGSVGAKNALINKPNTRSFFNSKPDGYGFNNHPFFYFVANLFHKLLCTLKSANVSKKKQSFAPSGGWRELSINPL